MEKLIDIIKNRLKKFTHLYSLYRWWKERSLQPNPPTFDELREIPGCFGRVHRYDFMLTGNTSVEIEGYNRIGLGAYNLVAEAIFLTNRTIDEIEALLDYGCGYGRVTRVFAQKLIPQKVSVFDVDPGAVSFCASEFGVKPIYFNDNWDYKSVSFKTYDVIWLGSVFTHLSEKFTRQTYGLLFKILKPKGILVFTTHGEKTLERLQEGYYGERFQSLAPEILDEFINRGFSFTPYEREEVDFLPFDFQRADDFGMTWMSDTYVDNLIQDVSNGSLKKLKYKSLGWDSHQDTYYYQRVV